MKYYLYILGCAMNYSDAERLSTVMDSLKYTRTFEEKEADVIFVIACSVRQKAIDKIYGKARDWKRMAKKRPLKLGLSGCVLKEDRRKMQSIFDFIFDIKDLSILPELIQNSNLKSHKLKFDKTDSIENLKFKIKNSENDYFSLVPRYESHFRAYVPISTGCNNFCSYCAVPYTRGREKSRNQEDIIKEIRALIKKGYKEITLLGQNVNSYGHDFGEGVKDSRYFVSLLKKIDTIPGTYRVYFYSNHPKDMSDELIRLMPSLKHFPAYIHLPLQSGNNEILKKMNRHYTKEDYLSLVDKIRGVMPGLALTTDVMVGFPGETEEQFADTVEVMNRAEFDMAFTAMYSERLGTASSKMQDDVSKKEKLRREKELVATLKKTALKNNKKILNKNVRVLFDSEKAEKLYGRTDGYKVVEVLGIAKTDQNNLIGQFAQVQITEVGPWKLVGKLI